MNRENIVQQKSYAFSKEIVELSKFLVKEKNEAEIGRQLLRCGFSFGSNIEEAITGQSSKKEYYTNLNTSYKHARETRYWLRLLLQKNILHKKQVIPLLKKCEELLGYISSLYEPYGRDGFEL